MKLPIQPLSQRDERWKLKRLGTSTTTIGNYGCLLTCWSMMAIYFGHEDMLPDVLNELFKTKGAYDQGNLLNFYKAGDVFDDVTADEFYNCYDLPCDLSKIYSYLDAKKPVIALVDFEPTPGIQTHFVLIHGYNDEKKEDLLCIDPWTGEELWFNQKYGDPARYIFGLRLYSGKPKEVINVEDKLSDSQDKLATCNKALAEKSQEVAKLIADLENQERDNKDLADQLLDSRDQRDQFARQAKELEGQVNRATEQNKSLQNDVDVLKGENNDLNTALISSRSLKTTEFSTKELVVILLKRLLRSGDA